MIELRRHKVKLLHLNLRTEYVGDAEVTAVDVQLGFDVPNRRLDELASGLRIALYEQSPDPDLLDKDGDHLTHLRFPELGKLRWATNLKSVGVSFHVGNGRGKGDLPFADARFGRLVLEPKEGGTVTATVRAQIHPSADEVGKLSALLKREIPVSVDLSEAVDADEDDGDE